jgi:hypothetical protein
MSEFHFDRHLCATRTISVTLSSGCAEYPVEGSLLSIESSRIRQIYLNDLPLERRKMTASL